MDQTVKKGPRGEHTHGAQHDSFRASPPQPHGPQFDEGFTAQSKTSVRGKLFDLFPDKPGLDRYGEHYDEFGWKQMPVLHGSRFDEGFSGPTALDGGEHGSRHDEFRDGIGVRYMVEGADYEGTVINCKDVTRITVLSKEGREHEIGWEQIAQYRPLSENAEPDRKEVQHANFDLPQDATGERDGSTAHGRKPDWDNEKAPRSDAEAPSAHSRSARGGGRSPVDPGLVDDLFANKAMAEAMDVLKASYEQERAAANAAISPKNIAAQMTAKRGGSPHRPGARVAYKWPGSEEQSGTVVSHPKCPPTHTAIQEDDVNAPGGRGPVRFVAHRHVRPLKAVGKSVDASERPIQAKDEETDDQDVRLIKSRRPACPEDDRKQCGVSQGGKCSACGVEVHDAYAEKTWMSTLDVLKAEGPNLAEVQQ